MVEQPDTARAHEKHRGKWDAQPTVASWVVDAERPFTVATQPSGAYNSQEPVTLTTSEPATIYYTTDGSTPSEASLTYTTLPSRYRPAGS